MKNQNILWFAILIVCGLSFFTLPAQAKYAGGRGTETEPYLIDTAEHMNILGDEPRDWDKHFKLIADIDFGGSTGAQFNFISYFSGVFDGNGHSIHDFEPLDSCASYKSGLFGEISAEGKVQNLTLVNPRLQCLGGSSSFSAGLLVGRLYGRVTNCHVIGGYIEKYFPPWPRTTTYGDIGGLVGSMYMDAVVSDCSVTGTIIIGDAAGGISGGTGLGTIQDCTVINIDINGGWYTGGIIARSMGPIERCSATGVIRSEGVSGGIVGVVGGPPNSMFDPVIRECYASCIVSSDDQAGGLAGQAANKCLIINCYTAGSVEGYSNGGLVCCYGNFHGTAPQVVNCYAAASVKENNKGGLIKHVHLDGGPVIVSNSFWDVEASGVMDSAGGTGITTAQMKTKDTFTAAGWDFTTPVWKMCDRPDYPRLWWEECPPPLIIYVDADATGANKGYSWDHAFNDLQDALVFAESSDEIRVAQGAYSPQGPLPDIRRASNPYPMDGSFSVSTNADLMWTAGSEAISHDVYFGTTSPGMFQGNQTATTFHPGTMAYGTIYYWRIDEVRDDGKTTGTVWSFATMLSPPPPLESGNEDESIEPAADRSATFQLKNGVVIKGGYAGFGEADPNARDIKVYETILTGDLNGDDGPDFANNDENSYHVVTSNDCDETAVLNGFIISAGNANGPWQEYYDTGGGMYNFNGKPRLINCIFRENWAHLGAGMANHNGSHPTLVNCRFQENKVDQEGGGMHNASNSSPTLTNCTFIGNSARLGGGMFNTGEKEPIITNYTFEENSADHGYDINDDNSSPILTSCIFIDNSAIYGGGMLNLDSSPELTNCTFTGNSADVGGGMHNGYKSNPTLTDCTFNGNSAYGAGGMINVFESYPCLTRCIFTGNSAKVGGGMHNGYKSKTTLTNCIFSGNSSEEYGGGMYNDWFSIPTLTNCIFSGNSSDDYGGGMVNKDSSPTLTNCIFSGNSSSDYGGGMVNRDSSPTLTNSILWGNIAATGPQIFDNEMSLTIVTYSDVQGGWPGQGNVDADPCFVEPGYFGPISCWKLDEAGGITAYDSVGQNHGTVYGAQWTTGRVSSALDFDGLNDYVSIPENAELNNLNTITLQAWICPRRDAHWHILDKGDGDKRIYAEGTTLTLDGRVRYTGEHAFARSTSHTLSLNTWQHVALTWSRADNTTRLYHNGVETYYAIRTIGTGDVLDDRSHLWTIGARGALGEVTFFDGLIDEAAIYDRVLSPEEIRENYLAGLGGQGLPDIIMPDYHLLEGSPCINSGDPDYIAGPNETDLDGRPRVIGGRIDMGSFEFNHNPIADAGQDQTVEAQAPWGATITLDGSGSSDADSTPGTIDDINDFIWYLLDPCDPNADVLLGTGRIIDCKLPIGEHVILLEVIDRAGASDANEVTISVQDTTPPDINCPPDVILECPADTSPSETGKATATDTCSDVTIRFRNRIFPGCGNTKTIERTWIATDEYGNSSSCMQVITVVDTTPPVITCPADVTLECPADTSVEANGSATAGDTCGNVAIAHSDQWQPDCGNTGTLTRTWMATDECGNSSSCVQVITVVDTTPPEFEFSVTPTMLWPPDHMMYEITPSWTVSDECDISPDVSLVGIVANEGDNTIGDGHTTDDIQISEDGSIYLRSERSGTGTDRIYTITYQAVDDCGNTTVRSATVSIPHDFKVLARIASRWLWSGPAGRIPEDLNGDGIVNLDDVARFAGNWTK